MLATRDEEIRADLSLIGKAGSSPACDPSATLKGTYRRDLGRHVSDLPSSHSSGFRRPIPVGPFSSTLSSNKDQDPAVLSSPPPPPSEYPKAIAGYTGHLPSSIEDVDPEEEPFVPSGSVVADALHHTVYPRPTLPPSTKGKKLFPSLPVPVQTDDGMSETRVIHGYGGFIPGAHSAHGLGKTTSARGDAVSAVHTRRAAMESLDISSLPVVPHAAVPTSSSSTATTNKGDGIDNLPPEYGRIPGYAGHVPLKDAATYGKTYSNATHDVLLSLHSARGVQTHPDPSCFEWNNKVVWQSR